jgi:hypothetical protein
MLTKYFSELRGASRWKRRQFARFFPRRPSEIYALMEAAGFSPSRYRNAWPDLVAALPSDAAGPIHYVQFLEAEVKAPRIFPLELNKDGLDGIARAHVFSNYHKASLLRNLLQSRIDADISITRRVDFWRDALATLAKVGRPLIVAGDSHSRLHRQTTATVRGRVTPLNILCGGGSAAGLPRPTSRSGYGELLRAAVGAIAEASAATGVRAPICFNFGQVDVEFVHTYRRARRREFGIVEGQFERFCESVVGAYIDWVAGLPPGEYAIFGVNPPCVDDDFLREAYRIQMQVYQGAGLAETGDGDLADTFASDFASLALPDKRQRTRNHRLLNAHLAKRASDAKLAYFDSFDELLGPDGLVRPEYTFAFDGKRLSAGVHGVDIHIGGKGALHIKAKLARRALASLTSSPRRLP